MAFLEGDDEITWGPDPELTPLGHEQTKAVGAAWAREAAAGAPIDKLRFFTSPLQRTCQTMQNTWGDRLGPPETWEVGLACLRMEELVERSADPQDFREIYGSHTCDKRSPKVRWAGPIAPAGDTDEPSVSSRGGSPWSRSSPGSRRRTSCGSPTTERRTRTCRSVRGGSWTVSSTARRRKPVSSQLLVARHDTPR